MKLQIPNRQSQITFLTSFFVLLTSVFSTPVLSAVEGFADGSIVAWRIHLTGTEQWKTATWMLPQCKFANRQNAGAAGADFWLFVGPNQVKINQVKLSVPQSEQGTNTPAVGPRGSVGVDVPLSSMEQKEFVKHITPEARTATAVQAACERAIREEVRVVFLPAGEYAFNKEVRVPGGLTLLGEVAKTLIRTKDSNTRLFRVEGDSVRFTRLKLHGADTTPSQDNNTYGLSIYRKKNVRIDHCELLGFSYATSFGDEATAQVDHCSIHHNLRDGLGYGVAIYSGAYVLVTDNEFGQNRHSLASNGELDWGSGERLGRYLHKPGVRKTHWEFLHNRVGSNDLSPYELCTVDTHPGMDGTFVVENNLFEEVRHAIGIRDGSGLIRGNVFRNLRGKPFRPFIAISISYSTHNGIPVENAMPHDIEVADNTFVNVGNQVFTDNVFQSDTAPPAKAAKYVVGQAENITIEGQVVPGTRRDKNPPPPMPRLQEMDENGILRWHEARPPIKSRP